MRCTKMAEPIKMTFGMWTPVDARNHVLDGGPDPQMRRAILRAKRGRTRTCLDMCGGRYIQNDSAEGRTSMMKMPIGCTKWRAHWHHLANTTELSLCDGMAMRPYVKYSLLSEILKFKNYQFESQVAITFVFATFDRVINKTVAYDVRIRDEQCQVINARLKGMFQLHLAKLQNWIVRRHRMSSFSLSKCHFSKLTYIISDKIYAHRRQMATTNKCNSVRETWKQTSKLLL